MTGKPFHKTRVILSDKILFTRLDLKDIDSRTNYFINTVSRSVSAPRLNIDLAIKSLGSGIGSNKKSTYENTDNKTRTNSGGEPGMVVTSRGIRYQPKEKNGPGKKLVLFPSLKSRESNGKTSNFGWLDEGENNSDIQKYIESQKNSPQIRIRKFKVNPKTDEIIPGSDIEMSPFKKQEPGISEKRLPGRSVGERGSSLLNNAAGKFGIVRDALNKFRCPPGTPAANQFTDSMGSNCFGQSAADLIDFAIDAFASAQKAFTEPNSRETLSKFFREAAYDADNGRFGSFFARTMWRDADGNKIRNLRKWNSELREGEFRIFTGAMANAQLELQQQDARISNLRELLGIPSTSEKRERNDDLREMFQVLKERGMLNVTLGAENPGEDGQGGPPTPEQVEQVVAARLKAVPDFPDLPREQQKKIIANDIQRFYETERALLEGFLDEYIKNPEHMQTIKNLVYEYKTSDAETLDEANYNARIINGEAIGIIGIDIPQIMKSQESMLPQLADNERLRIDVTGAKTDATAAAQLSDFLLTSAGFSKQHAATVEERGFARHIIKHEIAHSIQARAVFDEIKKQINENGFITVGDGKIESIDALTGRDLLNIMSDSADSVNLEMLNSALSRTNNIMFMAGVYPTQYDNKPEDSKILEATAELWALRSAGLIWGDDVDAALEWMDNIADGRTKEKRIRSDVETMRIIEESYYLSPGESSAPWFIPEDPIATAAAKKRAENKMFKNSVEKLDQDSMIDELSEMQYQKDVLELKIKSDKVLKVDTSKSENDLLDITGKEKIINSAWKKKYGTGSEDSKKLKALVQARRESMQAFTPDVVAAKKRSKKIEAIENHADSIDNSKKLIKELAEYDLRIRLAPDNDKKELKEERQIYSNRYKKLLEDSGDSRKWSEQKKEMEEEIDKILRPTKTAPLKKPKTPTTDKQATQIGNDSRSQSLRDASPRQRIAVTEFSDSETSSVAQLLDPQRRDVVLSAIKERNQRLKAQGLGINPTSRGEASVEEQVENILIPTMEVIDKSRIGTSIEMEADIELDVNDVTGQISLGDVSHETFVSGRVLSKKNPATVNPVAKPVVNGKQKRKVIIQTTEDDRGIFPNWSMDVNKDDKRPQKLVIPPGKLKIVKIRDDGTVVMQISEQKDTESVLGSLSDANIKGARINSVVDRYITERRANKIPREQARPLRAKETRDRGILATRDIKRKGGRFGEGTDDEVGEKLSSGATKTRAQFKAERIKTKKENLEEIRSVLIGEEPRKFKSLSRDSLDPEVADLIISNDPDAIIKIVEDAAVDMHNSMDNRARVRMRESELNDLTLKGEYNPRLADEPSGSDPSLPESSISNRRKRRLISDYRESANQIEAARGADEVNETGTQEFSPTKTKSETATLIARNFNRHSNKQLITRKSGQIIDAAMRRAGFNKDIREKVNFAIILISSYSDGNSLNTLTSLTKNIYKNSGPDIAELSVEYLVNKERLSLHNFNSLLTLIGYQKTKSVVNQKNKDIKLAFNIGVKAFNEIDNTIYKFKTELETKSIEKNLEIGKRLKTRKGSAAQNYRMNYEEEIGIPSDTPNSLRPVSGYVVNKSHIDEKRRRVQKSGFGNFGVDAIYEIQDKDIIGDGLTAFGEIEVVLRPETANRVAYGRGSSFDTRHQPVMLDSTEREDIVNAITINNGVDKDEKNLEAMLHLLGSSRDKNFSHVGAMRDSNGRMKPVGKIDPSNDRGHEIFEANILGGFSKEEVEGIHYPFSKIVKLADQENVSDITGIDEIKPKLQKLGFTSDEVGYYLLTSKESPIITPGIQKLKEYRAAKKIRKKYESTGIGYVKFAHPDGINIENPKTYDKVAKSSDDPESIIKQNIAFEIDGVLMGILGKMRQSKTRELVGDPQ